MTSVNWKQLVEVDRSEDAENVGTMMACLSNRGNPDHGQNPCKPISVPDRVVPVKSFADASRVCRTYIENHGLGGGSWAGGEITRDGQIVARVSYNGRVWKEVLDHQH